MRKKNKTKKKITIYFSPETHSKLYSLPRSTNISQFIEDAIKDKLYGLRRKDGEVIVALDSLGMAKDGYELVALPLKRGIREEIEQVYELWNFPLLLNEFLERTLGIKEKEEEKEKENEEDEEERDEGEEIGEDNRELEKEKENEEEKKVLIAGMTKEEYERKEKEWEETKKTFWSSPLKHW